MMRKKRGYKRETPVQLLRDYKLFAIACEGGKREPDYFKLFQHISRRITVDIIEEIVSDEEMSGKHENKSAPKWVLDRAIKYIEKEGLSNEDDLWFVIDKDRWTDEQLREIAQLCEENDNWHIVISNPCFEVWLYFHKKENISKSRSKSCTDFKNEISTLEKGGYHPHKFLPYLIDAINNSKKADSNLKHFIPKVKETKVYQLGATLIQYIGKSDWDEFIKVKIPQLIKEDIEKARLSTRNRKRK